ncbi:ATP-binding protein [Pelobacter seleniigenes]|uniref:ATP-binding protein n=1 Tax=Pelobacter seleniigenes TaxID=407188 RepID=UPI00138E08D0|nr:ATP-binding protein [Pelobacter seleniigenes]
MLIKAEGKLYGLQEKLDVQLKNYKLLYELNRNINSTFDIGKIFEFAVDHVVHNLEHERVFFLRHDTQNSVYRAFAVEGYYEAADEQRLMNLRLSDDDVLFQSLLAGAEYHFCKKDSSDLASYREKFCMQEFFIFPLGSQSPFFAFLVVGNSGENSGFYQPVEESEDDLLRLGNLVGLLSSRVDNFISFGNMEKALELERRAELKFRDLFENASEGIVQITGAGEVLSCNPAAANILGYSCPQAVIGKVNFLERMFVRPQRQNELFVELRQGRNVHNFEAELWRWDGSRHWVQIGARPVLDETGNILSVDGIFLDISERKKAEAALQSLNEELEQRVKVRTSELEAANRGLHSLTVQLEKTLAELKSAQSKVLQQEKMASIGQLAAGVAHEINNPMGFIISNLNTLKKYLSKTENFIQSQSAAIDTLPANSATDEIIADLAQQRKQLKLDFIVEDQQQLIDESLDGAERVKQIVQSLKSFSRIDEAEFKLADINEGLESTIRVVWNELKYKAKLTREFSSLPEVYCNQGQLNQVVMNLLINAAHAIENNGEIKISTSVAEQNVYISIADNGSGIPQHLLGRIFEPFYTTKDVGQGTGLGLSIAYDIIKQHNGEIFVESELGKGTIFTLRLPLGSIDCAKG